MTPPLDYAHLSEAEMSQHFMPRIAVPDNQVWLDDHAAMTVQARNRADLPAALLDRRYGAGPRQVMDLHPATRPGSPILLYIHGGYWRALSKDTYGFIAPPLVEAGAAVALINYDLSPTVPLATIVRQTVEALAWLRANAGLLNGDPDRIVVSGNSAGAHLAAMLLSEAGSDGAAIMGAALVTGIYDLAPIPRIQVRDDVHLTAEDIARLSPLRLPVRIKPPCLVAVGGDEPPLWIDQSKRYHEKLLAEGVASRLEIVPGTHHFSITRGLGDPKATLFRGLVSLLQL